MKVIVAHNQYLASLPSGENRVVDAEIAQLEAAGVTVLPFLRSSDEISSLPVPQKALVPLGPIYAPVAQRDLERMIRRVRPDIVHLHNPYPLLSPWVVRTAHRLGVPVIQTVHNYRQVCANGLYFRDGQVCHDCRGRYFPLPAIVHACYRGSVPQSAIMAVALTVHRSTWNSVERFIALTSGIAEHLRAYGIPGRQIRIKPNAIADPGPPPAHAGQGFVFASGRLGPEKGLGLLLDAWVRHPDGTLGPLTILGDGVQRGLAEQAAATRSDVVYGGMTDRAGVFRAMRTAAVVVASSTSDDVLPTAVIEALANGRPVLGTRRGGIPDVVGEAGWIVEPDADRIAELLPIAAAEADSLRVAARGRYEANFAPELLTRRLLEIYEEVLREAPGAASARES